MEGIAQQVRVLTRAVLAAADAPSLPAWAATSDFSAESVGGP
jgi:hypothetical protein